jgi:hypothetical protein
MILRRAVAVGSVVAVVATLGVTSAGAAPRTAGDDAIAEAALFTLADFPATEGWQSEPAPVDVPSKLPACAPARRARESASDLRTPSPAFERADGTAAASNVVYVFPSAAAAKRFLAPYRRPSYVRCLTQSTEAQLGDRAIDVDVVRTADAVAQGDQSIGFTITLSTDGTTQATLLVTAVREGRAIDGFTLRSVEGPLPGGDALMSTSLARLQQALAAS